MCPSFPSRTWFSESGRGSDGPVCPSFLKRVMPQRWFQDWGPGSRSQSPTHEEEEKFRPCGKPTSVIRGVSEPPATSSTAPITFLLSHPAECSDQTRSPLYSHRGAGTGSTWDPHFWGSTCGWDLEGCLQQSGSQRRACKVPCPSLCHEPVAQLAGWVWV